MKRRYAFLGAVIAATAAPALAQSQPDPGKMFMINAVTPGVVSFSGEGTATFNNSSSTSNAFSVGSNTAFGVNASAASTNDYMVDANALFQLGGESQLKQVLGTSSSAANTSSAASAAMEAATISATKAAESEFTDSFANFVALNGGTAAQVAAAGTGSVTSVVGGYEGAITTSAGWEQSKKEKVNELTQSNFGSTINTAVNSAQSGANADGVISGTFETSNKSQSQIGASANQIQELTNKGNEAANAEFGTTYTEYQNKFAAIAGSATGLIDTDFERAQAQANGVRYNLTTGAILAQDTTGNTSGTWNAEKKSFASVETASLANQAASSGNAESSSEAKVTVTGVGSNAELNAAATSAFNVDVATRIRTLLPDTNGTANGSAGGNLATSSFANQSNTQSASAFMQAFGADTVQLLSNGAGELIGARVSGRLQVDIDATKGGTGAPAVGGADGATNLTITVAAPAAN